jgi:hypothetical protein
VNGEVNFCKTNRRRVLFHPIESRAIGRVQLLIFDEMCALHEHAARAVFNIALDASFFLNSGASSAPRSPSNANACGVNGTTKAWPLLGNIYLKLKEFPPLYHTNTTH